MKIGFFGDSYVDLIWNQYPGSNPARELTPWSYRLVKDLNCSVVSSGLGGTNQYYAVRSWENHLTYVNGKCDVAIFSFTWFNRMYHGDPLIQQIMRDVAELRDHQGPNEDFVRQVQGLIDGYTKYLFDPDQAKHFYKLMVKEILDLPSRYPDTKFIFLPNNEHARKLLLDNFNHGVLVNFTFESLSNNEPNSPGPVPINCGRPGHLNNHNHDAMAAMIKNIIVDYEKFVNQVVDLDLSQFDLVSRPIFEK